MSPHSRERPTRRRQDREYSNSQHSGNTSRPLTPTTTVSKAPRSRRLRHLQTLTPFPITPEVTVTDNFKKTKEKESHSFKTTILGRTKAQTEQSNERNHHRTHKLITTVTSPTSWLYTSCPYTPPSYQDPGSRHCREYGSRVRGDDGGTIVLVPRLRTLYRPVDSYSYNYRCVKLDETSTPCQVERYYRFGHRPRTRVCHLHTETLNLTFDGTTLLLRVTDSTPTQVTSVFWVQTLHQWTSHRYKTQSRVYPNLLHHWRKGHHRIVTTKNKPPPHMSV